MYDPTAQIAIAPRALERLQTSFSTVARLVNEKRAVYGVTTGFGSLRHCFIDAEETAELQSNLIKSHAAGVGDPLPLPRARGMLVLRINSLLKGYSGVSPALVQYIVARFNQGIISLVPLQGSVGASGDLAPLSHLFLGYLGDGQLWDPAAQRYRAARAVLDDYAIAPLVLGPKEGLALNNGTPFMTVHLAEAVYSAKRLLAQADAVAALTLEALHGTHRAFHPAVSEARSHAGQSRVAAHMREILGTHSETFEVHGSKTLQDAYSLRCIPQVHGAVLETLDFAERIVETEMNSATDNPLIVGEDAVSGGNFHGQYPAMACDFLAIALTTLGNMSERRLERLVNSQLKSFPIPSFLIDESSKPGLHSGFMIVQYTAAALCAENRTLANPGSVHTIPTCENQEDHVSMGAFSARKLNQILDNVTKVIALELLCGTQAKEWTAEPSDKVVEAVYSKVRERVPRLKGDRFMGPDIQNAISIIENGELLAALPELHSH